jgi:hypothetical protein
MRPQSFEQPSPSPPDAAWHRDQPAHDGLSPVSRMRGLEPRDRSAKIEALLDLVTELIREKRNGRSAH